MGWKPFSQPKYGVVVYNYNPKEEQHLPLSIGETVYIKEGYQDSWYRGYKIPDKSKKGVFPTSYIYLKDAKVDVERGVSVMFSEPPIVQESTIVLREWGVLWKKTYKNVSNMEQLPRILVMITELIEMRRRIVSGTLPADEMTRTSHQIADLIDFGNKLLGLDLQIRNPDTCQAVDTTSLRAVDAFKMHQEASAKVETRITEERMKLQSEQQLQMMSTNKSHIFSLFVTVKNFVCRIGEDADVFMSLYDAKASKFISESYFVPWGKEGLPRKIEKLNNMKVIFTDLGSSEMQLEKIYFVCKIIRIGRMYVRENNSKKETVGLRRPFGVAVMDITKIIKEGDKNDDDKQHFIPFLQIAGDGENLQQCVNRAIGAKIDHKGQGVYVSIKPLNGDLRTILHDYQHLVDRTTPVARKMGFPEIIMPGDVRNDLYVTICQGEFEKMHKKSHKNVEVTMDVLTSDGSVIPMVICMAVSEEAILENMYRSHIYYQTKSPKWMEVVKVRIPIEDFYNAHLRFTFRHRSTAENKDKQEKPFGVSFVRLMRPEGTTLRDGIHNLVVYKLEGKRFDSKDARRFLPLIANSNVINGSANRRASFAPVSRSSSSVEGFTQLKDTFQISTLVCSTKLTQNVDLLGLLKWKSQKENLKKNLRSLMKVDGEEVVKFLPDTLDALFNIMMENPDCEFDALVFDALVYIIMLVAEKKFYHFHSVLDTYIEDHFFARLAYSKLTKVLVEYLKSEVDDQRDQVINSLRALEYIFKFIIRSRQLFEQTEDKGKEEFEEGIRSVFTTISDMMAEKDAKSHLIQQAMALKHIPSVIKQIIKIYSPIELSKLLQSFIQCIPTERLNRQKIPCMNDIVKSEVFIIPECRTILLAEIAGSLQKIMDRDEEVEACGTLLSDLLGILGSSKLQGSTKMDVFNLSKILLRSVIRKVIHLPRTTDSAGRYVACLISFLRQLDETHYDMYLKSLGLKIDIMDFLMETFQMFIDLIRTPAYREDWITMFNIQNITFMRAIKFFTKSLTKLFLDENSFEYQLWDTFFHLGVHFLTQESIQIEKLSPNRRRLVKKFGEKDLRCVMGFEIRNMWFNLGQHKIKFIPSLVGPILEMTLTPENDLRRATIPIFFDMMQCELHNNGNFKKFENEMITKLDNHVEGGKGDRDYQDTFSEIMSDWCKKHQFLKKDGLEFVNLVVRLFGRLLDYRDIIRDENRDNRMSCTVNLLNFYREINRSEMYVRYLHKLCDLHRECDNYTEAAFTLLQHARLLNWSDEPVTVTYKGFEHAKTFRQLKESLYYQVIELFEAGKMWEEGIKLCKEIAIQHENETFRYKDLAEILKRQAKLYENITTIVRPEPEYFFVGFYGNGFPSFQRNRTFIYRGKEYERLSDFTNRILSLRPDSKKMNTTAPPDDDILMSNDMHIQVYTVVPVMEEPNHFRGKSIDDQIRSFYKVNDVQKFHYSKPFRKGPKDKNNEFANMWIERSTFKISAKLPGILRWFEITSTVRTEFSPLENAVESMKTINQDLKSLLMKYLKNNDEPINPLSLKLNGVVDPRVMGGFANYEKAFLTDSYLDQNPDDESKILELKDLIASQIPLLEEGVRIHGERVSAALKPLHDNMMTSFSELKAYVVQKYGSKPTFLSGRNVQLIPPIIRKQSTKPRPESIISIASNISYSGDSAPPPEIPIKRPNSRTPSLNRSQSIISQTSSSSADPPSIKSNRRSKPSDWFNSNFGGSTNSLEKTGSVIELKEELTPARRPRPKSRTNLSTTDILPQRFNPFSTNKKPPALPMKAQGDYSNLPSDEEVLRRHEASSPAPIPAGKRPPPPLPVKRQEPPTPPKKPIRPPKSP